MKVIFLDFDGVIITDETKFLSFVPRCVDILKQILEKSNAKIVVSSTWRYKGLKTMKKMFRDINIDPNIVIDITPISRKNKLQDDDLLFGRSHEIHTWLLKNKVESFVVIDDDTFDLQYYKDRLITTNSIIGITKKQIEKTIEILNEKV